MTLPTRTQLFRSSPCRDRRGAAAVECAFVLPVLLLFFLGIVDTGQFANVGQAVSGASREAARVAARNDTLLVAEVETVVASYLADAFPGLPAGSATVTVTDGNGNAIAGGDLTTISAGSAIIVQVDLGFDTVRWISGLSQLDSRDLTATTMSRRE
jgi:Flp pilus assembly protein TadG